MYVTPTAFLGHSCLLFLGVTFSYKKNLKSRVVSARYATSALRTLATTSARWPGSRRRRRGGREGRSSKTLVSGEEMWEML